MHEQIMSTNTESETKLETVIYGLASCTNQLSTTEFSTSSYICAFYVQLCVWQCTGDYHCAVHFVDCISRLKMLLYIPPSLLRYNTFLFKNCGLQICASTLCVSRKISHEDIQQKVIFKIQKIRWWCFKNIVKYKKWMRFKIIQLWK